MKFQDVNGLVKCWNYNFKQCIYHTKNRQTYGLTYHPRLPKFITYGDNLKIFLYDDETKVQERVLQASDRKELHDGPMSRVFAGRFNPRSNYEFLTGGWDDLVHLWDLRAPHAVKHISGIHLCREGLDINKRALKYVDILLCPKRKMTAFILKNLCFSFKFHRLQRNPLQIQYIYANEFSNL
ncbi:hypothetical protein HHI36_006872 [Cryptolaemus montrouzieri]|uniref:Uncharacterized protein n=1 Tax=Cryptolaemus montrouzieri TaxID=559131 RepID=A0ABD2MMY7_9CUCU